MRIRVLHPELVEAVGQNLAAFSILLALLLEEAALLRLLETDSRGLLERRVAAEDDAGRGGERGPDERGRANQPPDAPACGGEELYECSMSGMIVCKCM